MLDAALRILIIDENAIRAAILEDGLREAGYLNVSVIREMPNLIRQISALDPDVIFIDLENPNRDVLEHMFQVSKSVQRPIAMFVDQSDTTTIERAVEAGVSTYIVDGLRKDRVKPILDMTLSRFNAFNRLQRELEQTKRALDDRKFVDRAKALLMSHRNIDEPSAYRMLRDTAMRQNQTIGDVARALLTANTLLEGEGP
ncbi:MAG: ANTAR domain-containing protein [Pseudomonadota bacterium]